MDWHFGALAPKYMPYTCMDPLGGWLGFEVQGLEVQALAFGGFRAEGAEHFCSNSFREIARCSQWASIWRPWYTALRVFSFLRVSTVFHVGSVVSAETRSLLIQAVTVLAVTGGHMLEPG